MTKRPLSDEEKKLISKRIDTAQGIVAECEYIVAYNKLQLGTGLDIKVNNMKKECKKHLKSAERDLSSEKKCIEDLQDQIDNGVEIIEIKEHTKKEETKDGK